MVDRFQNFSYYIFEIYRCWHKLAAEEMTPYGLKGPYAVYLISLQQSPQGLTAAELCSICGRDKADVSRAISVMEEKGLVERSSDNTYRARLKLTEQGDQAAAHISQRISVAVELAAQGYDAEQRTVFYQVLAAITDNLHNLTKTGLPE